MLRMKPWISNYTKWILIAFVILLYVMLTASATFAGIKVKPEIPIKKADRDLNVVYFTKQSDHTYRYTSFDEKGIKRGNKQYKMKNVKANKKAQQMFFLVTEKNAASFQALEDVNGVELKDSQGKNTGSIKLDAPNGEEVVLQSVRFTYSAKKGVTRFTLPAPDIEPSMEVYANQRKIHINVNLDEIIDPYSVQYRMKGGDWSPIADFYVKHNGKYEFDVSIDGSIYPLVVQVSKMDTTKPIITSISGPVPTGFATEKTITVKGAEDPKAPNDKQERSGLASEPYSFDEGITWQAEPSITVYEEKEYCVWVRDKAGNIYQSKWVNADKIDRSAPEVLDWSVTKVKGTAAKDVVKTGDIIKVRFRAIDVVEDEEGAGVDGATVKVKANNGRQVPAKLAQDGYYSCKLEAGKDFSFGPEEDECNIPIEIRCADKVGNEAAEEYAEVGILYYAPIKISDLKMTSNNEYGGSNVAKNGDLVQVTFHSNHPIIPSEGKVAGKSVSFHSNDEKEWTAVYNVKNEETRDNENISFQFAADDAAGNETVTTTQGQESIKYYAPIKISKVSFKSNNRKNVKKYAKNGDTLTLTFHSNHQIQTHEEQIAKHMPQVQKSKEADSIIQEWQYTYKIKNEDLPDLKTVGFSFVADDIAGNQYQLNHKTKKVKNRIRYFAPLQNETSIVSSYKNTAFVKNGDQVIVKAKFNHTASLLSASIAGRTVQDTGGKGTKLNATYTIPKKEGSIREGLLSFSYKAEDPAGNLTLVDKANAAKDIKVTYDRTNPTVTATPDNIAFSNEKVNYTFTFEDKNLDPKEIDIAGGAARASKGKFVGAEKYVKTTAVSADGDYELEGRALDKAGNEIEKPDKIKVTIDKTAPIITAKGIDLYSPKAFKSGFVIADHFDFIEENLKEVVCSVTDSGGTYAWDPKAPLSTDGKKSIIMIAKDMANNTSEPVSYDLYVDGTKPKVQIKDMISLDYIEKGQKNKFIKQADISIKLQDLNIADITKPDQLKILQLYDDNGTLVKDFLTSKKQKTGTYKYKVDTLGEYTLKIRANDSVGNDTGVIDYNFTVGEKTLFEKYYENTPFFIISLVVIIAAVGLTATLILRRRWEKKTEPRKFDL